MVEIEQSDFQIPIEWLHQEEISLEGICRVAPDKKSLHPNTLLRILSYSALPLKEETFYWKKTCLQLDDDDQNASHIMENGVEALSNMIEVGLLFNLEMLVWDFFLDIHSTSKEALVAYFEAIKFTNVQHFSLRCNYIGDNGAMVIVEIVKSGKISSLCHLDLSFNSFWDGGVEVIASVLRSKKLHELQHLNMFGNIMGLIGSRAISAALQSGKIVALEHLDISSNNIGDEGAQVVSKALQLGKLDALKHLDMSFTLINDGEQTAKGLQVGRVSGSTLQRLKLAMNNLEAGPGKVMAAALGFGKVPAIKLLNFTDNYFSNKGAMAVIEALHSSTDIQHLEFAKNSIGKEAAMALAARLQSEQIPALEYLNFAGNNLCKEGQVTIVTALQAGKIATLELQDRFRGFKGAASMDEGEEKEGKFLFHEMQEHLKEVALKHSESDRIASP